jgi:GT2 family glycosyltransferase
MKKVSDELQPSAVSFGTPESEPNALSKEFQSLARNRISRIVAALRKAKILQPLHNLYGPVKYDYVLPVCQRAQRWFRRSIRGEVEETISYELWAERCERLRYNSERAADRINGFTFKPTISLILPVFNSPPEYLRKAIDSVGKQYYTNWELCICDDASTNSGVGELLKEYAAKDGRIKVTFADTNQGIAAASNSALQLATGEFIGLLDHDDELTPDALLEIVATLQETEADLIYSDEDRLDAKGQRTEPAFKPSWSPDLLFSCMYLSHFCVYRKRLVDRLQGFRQGFDGSQDYDLALRYTEETNKIVHIPKILYHWRKVSSSASARPQARPAVIAAGQRALTEALARRGIQGEVESETQYGFYRVRRKITGRGRVSILIPTRDGLKHLRHCLDSIQAKTDYRNYEILIIDNGSQNAAMLSYLESLTHRVMRCEGPFNYSRLNNLAARQASGDYLLFLNDDTEVISGEWLSAMLEQAERAEVGAVGAKLLYKDGRIQHAGIVLGLRGVAGHAHRYADGFHSKGYLNYPNLIRNYSAVTAACMMMRHQVFDDIGGFDEENFPVSYNDVDLCLRLNRQGYLITYTPYALLYHHESATRGLRRYPREESFLRGRWANELISDKYYNPNLTLRTEDFSVDMEKPESLVCNFSQESDDEIIGQLDGSTSVGQEFVAEQDNLCAIAVRIERIGFFDKGQLRLRLRESGLSQADVAVADLAVAQVLHKGWSVFYFDALADSCGKRFYFCLELMEPSPDSRMAVLGKKKTRDAEGESDQPDQQARGSLAFRVYSLQQFR